MAVLIPALSTCVARMTSGERRLLAAMSRRLSREVISIMVRAPADTARGQTSGSGLADTRQLHRNTTTKLEPKAPAYIVRRHAPGR